MTDKQKNWIISIDKFLEVNSENWVRFDGEEAKEVFPELFSPRVQKYRLKTSVFGFEEGTIWINTDNKHICYKEYKLPLKHFSNFLFYFEIIRDEPTGYVKDINLPEGSSEVISDKPAPITGKLLSRITSMLHDDSCFPYRGKIDVNLDGSFGGYRAQGSLCLTAQSSIPFSDISNIKKALEGYLEIKLIRK